MSSSSVAAPAVVDKHAELLKMVAQCNHYKLVRTLCMHCCVALFDASPKTVDCRLGELCGCGARYCGNKCLVAASQEHKEDCDGIQAALQFYAKRRFCATEITNQVASKCGGFIQIELLRADMLVTASDVVGALVWVAESVRNAEAFELAQSFAQRALSLSAKGSLAEAEALIVLGNVASTLSMYHAAVAHYEAALKTRKSLLGDNHDVASVYINLSTVFECLGRLDEALAMCSSALEIFNKAPGNNQKSIAICHQSMGCILDGQRKHDEAMEHFSTGLAISLRTEGETASAADFLVNIGTVLCSQNKLDEAMEKFVSALRIYERAKSDTRVATCHQNIGYSLMQQGKFDEALEHVRKALAIRRSKLPHEHADCGDSHYLIGDILQRSGKFADAVDEFENALRILKNVFGEMTVQVAEVYRCKAECFFNLQKWREAVTFFEATIHIRTVLGADFASLIKLKADLATTEEQLKAEQSRAAVSESRK